MENKEKFIQIQSSINIGVTPGLNALDISEKDAHVPDRLKVQALWPKLTVNIKSGQGVYPEVIKNWNSVKKLAEKGIITIGQVVDETIVSEDDKQVAKDLSVNLEEVKSQLKTIKQNKLSAIADEIGE